MSIPTNLQTLLAGNKVEWERVEFKESWNPSASLKTICAFANDLNNWGGGYVVIGVRDEADKPRELVGVTSEKADAWLKDILNKCRLIQPSYMPIVEVADYQGKTFIVLWCPGGSTRPYSAPKTIGTKSERVCWIRRLSSTVKPNLEEERDLYTLANNVPFDDRINHVAELNDLNIMFMKAYLREVGSSLYEQADSMDFIELCRNMHIVDGPPEYTKPLNVGLLFFSSEPERFFPYAWIDVVEFPEGEGGDIIIEHSFKGPLHMQLRDAMRYLTNNVVAEWIEKRPDGTSSEHHFNYPSDALKEALANAVYHKSYEEREPIEVRVLPDRIEVLSHPGADRSISLEGLKNYRMACRRYRNRRIGEYLKELGLTEGRNTGIHKMLKTLRQNGSPDPLFETDEDRLYFMTTIYAHKDSVTSQRVSRKQGIRRAQILTYFAENPDSTLAAAQNALKIPIATLNRDIAVLREEGQLTREGPDNRWVVRRGR